METIKTSNNITADDLKFVYVNGNTLYVHDLGGNTLIISVIDNSKDVDENYNSIILEPEVAAQFGRWILRVLGFISAGPDWELLDLLKRLYSAKDTYQFRRGDKKVIRFIIQQMKGMQEAKAEQLKREFLKKFGYEK